MGTNGAVPAQLSPAEAVPHGGQWLGQLSIAPLCLVAGLAPLDPQLAYQYGLWLAGLALLINGRVPRVGAVDVLAVLLGAWVTSTSIWTRDPAATAIAVRVWWTVILVFLAARHVIHTRPRLLLIALAFLVGSTWAGVKMILVGDENQIPGLRVGIEGVGVNYTAYSLSTGVVVGLLLLVAVRNRLARIALLLTAPILLYATVLTGTRASLVALAAVALYLLLDGAIKQAWVLAAAVSLVLLFVVPFGDLSQFRPEWLEHAFSRPLDDLSGRLAVWPIAEASFWKSPMLGIGVGAFPSTNPYFGIGAHSLMLTLGNDIGLVGIAMFVALVSCVLRDAAPTDGRRHRMLVGALIVVSTPIWLSGHWETSPAVWSVLAIWSRLPLALVNPRPTRRHRRAYRGSPFVASVGAGPGGRQAQRLHLAAGSHVRLDRSPRHRLQ
ncbi:O-antigen ligase family protein [Micromonospora sp. WMMD1155]|uniref:O-antigen ligase family protein n=1 Tax=Micromonospora sp. WMMD1155 TaxID=3016094 RepID=UPI00249C464F|nr:O-antigen ligase family protein [Micromonospora sp. WMMD1155]